MKKILKSVLFTILFITTLSAYSIAVNAQSTCSVSTAKFSEITGDGTFESNFTNLEISTSNCDFISMDLMYINELGNHIKIDINSMPDIFFPNETTGKVNIKLKLDEASCDGDNDDSDGYGDWGYECITYFDIYDSDLNEVFSGKNSIEMEPDNITGKKDELRNIGILVGQCDGAFCKGDIPYDYWDYDSITSGTVTNSSNCTLSNTGNSTDVWFDTITPSMTTGKDVVLHIKTKGKCDYVPFKIKLWEEDGSASDNSIDLKNGTGADYMIIRALPDEDLWVKYKGDEDDCEGHSDSSDCEIYVQISKLSGQNYSTELIETENFITNNNITTSSFLNNINYKKGVIVSECEDDGDCKNWSSNDWKFLETNGKIKNSGNSAEYVPPEKEYDEESPCFDTELGEYDKNCYELLAPIPGINKIDDGNGNLVDDPNFTVTKNPDGAPNRIAIKDIREFKLGTYINKLFQIAVAILGVIAVIMIIISGVQYMTVESIFGKQVARQGIVNAISGLILSLGIFLILHTINPQLLEINFGEGVKNISIKLDKDITTSNIIGDSSSGVTTTAYTLSTPPDIYCPKSGKDSTTINKVMSSFAGKTTYRIGGKGGEGNNNCPTGTVCLDCSGYANHLLRCTGFTDYPTQGTTGFFTGSNVIGVQPGTLNSTSFKKIDGTDITLKIGDLLGWKNTDAGTTYGHVLIYVGGGKVTDSHGGDGKNPGKAIGLIDLNTATNLKQKIKWVRQAI